MGCGNRRRQYTKEEIVKQIMFQEKYFQFELEL